MAAAPPGCRVESPVVVRMAGLPASALSGLRLERTLDRVDAVLDREAALAAEGEALAGALHRVIGDLADPALRPGLVGLRRALHGGRPPRAGELNEGTRAALGPALTARVQAWADALAERRRWEAELPDVLAGEVAVRLPALRRALAGPRFRHGLVQSSASLSDELEAWLARTDGRPPGRPALSRLARYLSRATTKTSPYSTFTTTGLATWTAGHGPAVRLRPGAPACGLLELHADLVRRLRRALAARPDLRPRLRVRVNPSAVEAEGCLVFLGPGPGEPVVAVAATPEVRECLRAAAAGEGGTFEDLARALAPAEGGASTRARVDRYLLRLAEAGLLELHLPVAEQSEDPLGEVAAWLVAGVAGRPDAVAGRCRDLRDELRPPTAIDEVAGHRARLRACHGRMAALAAAAGFPWDGEARGPLPALHEHTVFTEPAADLARERWQPALDDLDAIRRWIGLHDPGLALRLALGAYCADRFAPAAEAPFPLLHRALQEDLRRSDGPAGVADLRALLGAGAVPSAARLDRVRELDQLRRGSLELVTAAPAGPDGVVRVDPRRLAEAACGRPAWVPEAASVTCYVQPVVRDGRLSLALNGMTSGHGRGRGRWLRLVRRAGAGGDLEPSAPEDPGGRLLAESHGTFGTALNVRLPLAAHEIDYPHTVSDHAAARRLPLSDLVVRREPETGAVRLLSGRLGAEVVPVHGGMAAEFLLPPALQLLVRAFGGPTLLHPAIPLLQPPTVPNRVDAVPRVEVGRVVLRRAAWAVPHPCVPVRERGEADAAYLLRVHRWRRRHGIPNRCFLQAVAPRGASPQGVRRSYRKPLFVDFGCWFLVTVFERLVREPCALVVLTEALPDPEDGDRVAEFLVELTASG